MYDTILVPTDGSDHANEAIAHAVELASKHDATIHALYVIDPVYIADDGIQYLLDSLRRVGERAVKEVAESGAQAGVTVVTEIRQGTPHREILGYVDDEDLDLVVMGTQGRTGLDRYLLGSVTEKVVRLSRVPVLTIRSHDEA